MDKMSDAQRVALNSILTINNIDYRTLAAEVLEVHHRDAPGMYSLSYDEAAAIICYGNHRYKGAMTRPFYYWS